MNTSKIRQMICPLPHVEEEERRGNGTGIEAQRRALQPHTALYPQFVLLLEHARRIVVNGNQEQIALTSEMMRDLISANFMALKNLVKKADCCRKNKAVCLQQYDDEQ